MEKIKAKAENKKVVVAIILFHIMGLVGLILPDTRPIFIKLVPSSLLFLLGLLLYVNRGAQRAFLLFTFGVFICGFLAEVLGVHANGVFSKYIFGDTLGFKLAAVPIIMGFYFVLIIYSVGQLTYFLPIRSIFLRAFAGSCLILLFDYFLEPIAGFLNYWKWVNGSVPYQNYIAWFVFSFVMLQFFYTLRLPLKKFTGAALFGSQLLLFIALYYWA